MECNADNPLYKLKWYKYAANIFEDIGKEHLESCKYTDVTLVCGLQYVKAHKLILSASSDFFKHIFEVHSYEDPVVTLSGIDISELNILLQFIYQGQVKILESELDKFLQAAQTLQIKGLSQIIQNYKSIESNIDVDAQKNVNKVKSFPCKVTKKVRRKNLHIPSDTISSPAKIVKIQETISIEEDATSDDGSLQTIKVEPPEIRDIDEGEDLEKWKLIDSNIQMSETNYNNSALTSSVAEQSSTMQTDESTNFGSSNFPTAIPLKIVHQDEEHIPRPPNAFMIFANEWRRKVAQHHPEENNKEISIRLGQMWKRLDPEEKDHYYRASHIADRHHREKYPNYYYSPKEARIRKTLRQKKRALESSGILKISLKEHSQITESESEIKSKDFPENKFIK